jgi:CBS domain-containing protein
MEQPSILTHAHPKLYHIGELSLFNWARLKVTDIMSRDVISVPPDQTVQAAAQIMSDRCISCVMVMEGGDVRGVLTQKDLMEAARTGRKFSDMPVSDHMSHPVRQVPPETPVLHAGMLMEDHHIKRLPVTDQKKLVGIVTQTDLVRAFESMSALKSVTEIMTTDIVDVAPEITVAQALERMVAKRISCVVILQNRKAIGILTEKDILRSVLAQGKNPADTSVVDVMSFPLVTVSPNHSVLSANRLMDDKHIHRLIVCDENGSCGLITRTDVAKGLQTHAQLETKQSIHLITHAKDAIFMVDAQGRTTYVNPSFLTLFKTDNPRLFIDKPFPPDELWVDPADRGLFLAAMDLDDGGIQKLLLKTVTGDYLSVGMCLTDTHDVDGHLVGKQGVIWDISQDSF